MHQLEKSLISSQTVNKEQVKERDLSNCINLTRAFTTNSAVESTLYNQIHTTRPIHQSMRSGFIFHSRTFSAPRSPAEFTPCACSNTEHHFHLAAEAPKAILRALKRAQ